mgnify:CR=1 FL=1
MPNIINIPAALKQLRKTSSYTAKDVTQMLTAYNINISEKTLYGYENGISMPNADTFVALCMIYRCDNPLDAFGGSGITTEEFMLIKKYRALDERGKSAVQNALDHEYNSLPGETADTLAKEA